ncbi:HupE/UreJ family protein [Sinimarinibacterium sp. CAU 1509]|uniref:HupE/UreJ family protein n=1 Tax=Sinimarinibacterium sp. CAU 1509 TaxID=2562283 RepID=UPI0010AD9C8E|nr:HupE/UreJ family protein [Sinimarinibacterium sp. CAU 1509]TJY56639.1 HupE/UreJ family protein [Sinimarinibacterium sp. CAU 1509]
MLFRRFSWIKSLAALILACIAGPADAHRPSDAFLDLSVQADHVEGHWEIALRDLASLVVLDRDGDHALSWGELRAAQPALARRLLAALSVTAGGQVCDLEVTDLQINDRLDGRYAWFGLRAQCSVTVTALRLDYALLFDPDPTHRGIVVLHAGDAVHAAVLSPQHPSLDVMLETPSRWRSFVDFLYEGVWHIWIGYDHILFLIALLLPAVWRRQQGHWIAVERLAPALREVAMVVSAFTVAHSITLSLAALEWVNLPGRWVELAIAASVLLAALNNLTALIGNGRWMLAFAFGLIHGFGFAGVLGELGLPQSGRVLALLAFNLGVELGQLSIVVSLVPIMFRLRATRFYRDGIFTLGSIAVAAVACVWMVQRATGAA